MMTKARRKSAGENQLQLLPDAQSIVPELRRKSAAVSAAAQRILEDLEKGVSLLRLRSALGPLSDDLRALQALSAQLNQLESSWAERIEREVLEMEAAVRDALRARGWQVDGQWPKLYVERAVAVVFDERNRSFKIGDKTLPGASATEMVSVLGPLIDELIPRNFSETRFMHSLADAYDELHDGKSSQLPILKVYRQLVLRQQKPHFWKDARTDSFVGMSIDQFRARLSRALMRNETTVGGNRELRLLPPIDPKNAVYLYQPAEGRFGFVGRIEFVPIKATVD
jgi:hypothetical protein